MEFQTQAVAKKKEAKREAERKRQLLALTAATMQHASKAGYLTSHAPAHALRQKPPLSSQPDEKEHAYAASKLEDGLYCDFNDGETIATSSVYSFAAGSEDAEKLEDEAPLCLYCYEPLDAENPIVDSASWDTEEHAKASPDCGVFGQSCHSCLLSFVNEHEQDPKKEGRYPCPLCRVSIREPAMKNIAHRTCKRAAQGSAVFQQDCRAYLEMLKPENTPHSKATSRQQRIALQERDASCKTELESLPDIFRDEPWYKEALARYTEDHKLYRKVRARYYELWPRTVPAAPAASSGNPRGAWQQYDPALWEAAAD
jgi:hypothetical protein